MLQALSILAVALGSPGPEQPPPVLNLRPAQCPTAATDNNQERYGDRAIFGVDGRALVVQCGDGSVLLWRAEEDGARRLGEMPLFRAAQQAGLVPGHINCIWPFDGMEGEPDCEVLDRTRDGRSFVIENVGTDNQYVTVDGSIQRFLDFSHRSGALMPRRGPVTRVLAINEGSLPAELISVDLANGSISTIGALPSRNLIFEDDEGRATEVAYSGAHDLVIVSYGGVFRVARDMVYLRALSPEGVVRWEIREPLPEPNSGGFTDDYTQISVFDEGRFAVLGRASRRYRSDVIDLGTGEVVGRVPGWPIAASAGAERVMIKTEDGDLMVFDWRLERD
jgi:hypothetical protein